MPAHGQLRHAQAQHMGTHLHFDGPAEAAVVHVQRIEGIAADCAVGAKVGDGHAPEQPHQQACQGVAETLRGGHGPGVGCLPNTDHQVGAMCQPGQQRAGILRVGRAIAVDEQQRFAPAGAHRLPAGAAVTGLTPREFDLLWHFVQHPGRVFTRGELLADVWGYGHDGYDHTVNSHINRLRSKLGDDHAKSSYIHTVWGVGYRFEVAR